MSTAMDEYYQEEKLQFLNEMLTVSKDAPQQLQEEVALKVIFIHTSEKLFITE